MALHRRRDSPYFFYDLTIRGHRLRGSTQTNERAAAEAVEAKVRHDAIFRSLTGQRPG
jgi:hypothetical protein